MADAASSLDLTPSVARYMDRHLLIPLIDFLSSKNIHQKEDLEKSKLDVLFKTNMVDFAMDIYKELHGTKDVPADMSAKRDSVVAAMQALREEVAPILDLVSDAGRVNELKMERCFTQAYLQQQLNITPQHVEVLYRYAKFVFECGDYRLAADLLQHYRTLTCARAAQHLSARATHTNTPPPPPSHLSPPPPSPPPSLDRASATRLSPYGCASAGLRTRRTHTTAATPSQARRRQILQRALGEAGERDPVDELGGGPRGSQRAQGADRCAHEYARSDAAAAALLDHALGALPSR